MSSPKIVRHDNGWLYAVWSVGRRSRRKSLGTQDRAVAEERFAQWLLRGGHRGDAPRAETAALTIADLWAVYDARHVTGVASPDSLRFAWKNLEPHFGALAAADVGTRTTAEYGRLRAAGRIGRAAKPATVRRELSALRACLNWCARPSTENDERLIDPADIQPFDLPPDSEPRDRWLDEESAANLLAAALPPEGRRMSRVERFVWIALHTGPRKTAIRQLTWDRVDFDVRMIRFAVPGQRKTKKRRSNVPINDALLPVLRRMKAEATSAYVLDHPGDGLWSAVQALAIRAGLAPAQSDRAGRKPRATGVSPHVFRHTFGTQLARNGVDLFAVAGLLGDTLTTTERTYAHHCPGRMLSAVNTLGSGK